MKRWLWLGSMVLCLALGAYLTHLYGNQGVRVQGHAIQVPYLVERAPLKPDERVRIEPCVPIETVVGEAPVPPREGSSLLEPPGAFIAPSRTLFPLHLGSLPIDPLPNGGLVQVRLEDNGSGAGRLAGTVVPNQPKPFRWGGERSAGLGLGYNPLVGPALSADVRAQLLSYRRWALEGELRVITDLDRVTPVALLEVRYRF